MVAPQDQNTGETKGPKLSAEEFTRCGQACGSEEACTGRGGRALQVNSHSCCCEPDGYNRWKEERQQQQAAAAAAAVEQRRRDILTGRIPIEQLTGRELAEFHPEVFEGY